MLGSSWLNNIWLVPLLPLVSSILLMLSAGKMPKRLVSLMGAGSVGLSAGVVCLSAMEFLKTQTPFHLTLWTWMEVGNFAPQVAFYIDNLTVVMMSVITGVGFLIHVFSMGYMEDDECYCRYFAYLNLFVFAMLMLVMGDNLVLLYLGWEGVGLCSYLLIGFWFKDSKKGAAARKAFVVTRVGDTAMALGLFLLFVNLGTLEIQPMMAAANLKWAVGDTLPILAAALLVGGAVGKSAQLPLHTWLPDAMAGPTPVSALIHAATMVTAGVYLIARTHELFLLAPPVLIAVALIGLFTSLLAAFTALNQTDIKGILAYSTISQIGYMFLGLGVGAWTAGIFHLMTHAFFKALLFLGAGAVIHCLHHEQNIFKMGGLYRRLPIPFIAMLVGSAALAALPWTSGYFSKDWIVLAAYEVPEIGPWLWAGAILGALLTAIYSFRLVFIVFFGEAKTEPHNGIDWRMGGPLLLLAVLAIIGGWFGLTLGGVFPHEEHPHPERLIHYVTMAVPIIGVTLSFLIFMIKKLPVAGLVESSLGKKLGRFWYSGWKMDALYDMLFVNRFNGLSAVLANEKVDAVYHAIVGLSRTLHALLSELQTGRVRWYATCMLFGLIVLMTILLGIY